MVGEGDNGHTTIHQTTSEEDGESSFMSMQSLTVNSHMQGACPDLSSTCSLSPNPLNPLSPPKSHPNSNSDHCSCLNAGTLSILYFNARSLIPKFDELCLLVETHQPDIVCIVETWLDHNISD